MKHAETCCRTATVEGPKRTSAQKDRQASSSHTSLLLKQLCWIKQEWNQSVQVQVSWPRGRSCILRFSNCKERLQWVNSHQFLDRGFGSTCRVPETRTHVCLKHGRWNTITWGCSGDGRVQSTQHRYYSVLKRSDFPFGQWLIGNFNLLQDNVSKHYCEINAAAGILTVMALQT